MLRGGKSQEDQEGLITLLWVHHDVHLLSSAASRVGNCNPMFSKTEQRAMVHAAAHVLWDVPTPGRS